MIGPKTWDRTCGIFLGFSWMAVTAQKFRGAIGSLNSKKVALNHVFVWKIPGMGCGSVPKHGTEIVGILWRFYGLSVTVQNFSGCGLC